MQQRVDICGVQIDNVTMEEALASVRSLIQAKKPVYVVTANIDHIVKLQNDAEFRQVYRDASLVLADGMPLIWASRFLNTPLKGRVSGSDIYPALCEMAAQKKYKVFFLGGRSGAAVKAAEVLRARFSGLEVVGVSCPPFGFEKDVRENARIIESIKKTAPDILFVGLGAPKQEKWIGRHIKECRAPVSIGIGASFDFISGLVKRAPAWMQKAGLEWLWRLIQEPSRLWKRYLIDDVRFFWLVARQKFAKGKRKN